MGLDKNTPHSNSLPKGREKICWKTYKNKFANPAEARTKIDSSLRWNDKEKGAL
jgi:hypothetical protein